MTAALERDECSAARPGRTLLPGKNRYPFYRRLGGPQGWCGRAKSFNQKMHTILLKGKVKVSRYRTGVVQSVGRGIALLFHGRSTRRGWVVSSTPRPHFTPGKDPVPTVQEAGWAPGPVWTGTDWLLNILYLLPQKDIANTFSLSFTTSRAEMFWKC